MKNISLVFLAVTFFSCISERSVVRPEGSNAEIALKGGSVLDAELLAIRERNLVCRGDSLMEIPFADIIAIDLLIEESRGWVAPVIIFQALPSALILFLTEVPSLALPGWASAPSRMFHSSFPGPRFTLSRH